jgi:hypothetical protein
MLGKTARTRRAWRSPAVLRWSAGGPRPILRYDAARASRVRRRGRFDSDFWNYRARYRMSLKTVSAMESENPLRLPPIAAIAAAPP